jgi:PAS domain S-box-containing protein
VGTSLAAEPLLALAVTVTSEQRVESVLQSIVGGLASQPGVALARIWLLPSADFPRLCYQASDPPDSLCLVASAGAPINSPGEDWCFLQGRFARIPFNVGKIGQVAASRHAILVEDVAAQNDWVVRPEWARREEIRSFLGHPLIFRDKLLGVIGVFSRQALGQQEFTWLGLFANQAALAIANACAEQALHSSERNLAAIIDTIPTLAWCNLPDGSNEFLNKGWHEYTGLSPEESHGWGWQVAFHPEDVLPLMEKWRKMLVSGESDEIEARLRRHDGVYRWFLIRAQALRNDSGKIVRWYGTSTDIEDRKQAEEALHSSERNLAAIINTIPTGAWTTRPDGYRDFINQVWLDYAGMTAEQAQGWGWAEAIHPDDRQKLVNVWQSSLASGTPVDTETRIRRFDGSYRWFLTRANPLRDESGKILKWYGTNIDIEDRKRAEEALRARELDARSLLDNMPGFLGRHSPDGTPEIVNRPFLQYQGKTVEEVGQWRTSDIVHPDDVARVIEGFANGISSGEPWCLEFRLRRFDGIYRWFQARWVPVHDIEGRILHWNALTTDIDDRKKAEEALQSSERSLSLIINAIPALIHTTRADGYIDYFNQRWLEYVGCSLNDVEGWKWTSKIHTDDLQGILDKWRACLASGEIFEYETRVRRADGQYRWMLHRKVPLRDEQGNIVRWYGTSLDIEDRKRAEALVEQAYLRLAEAQRLSKTGSFITDLVADDHNWSEEAFRIFEFDPSTKVTVHMIRDCIYPDDLPSFDAVFARGTETDVNFVFRIVTARGVVKHIRGMARVITQIGSHPLFIGAFQDVTESKVAEEALDRARSELAHVARVTTLNALTASIAHEINQPLSGIITNASTCLRMLNGEPPNIDGARETARRTLRDGNRASDVITRLRGLFGKKESVLEQLDLNEATREVIALSLSDLQRNRVILQSDLADDLPPIIGDRIQLQQVTLNLLRNASDAMLGIDDRPRQLLVRTRRDGEGRVHLSVQDSGIGIHPHDCEKLFEPFYTSKSGGMGIGLSVSRSIIEKHHGRLWVEPNNGPGATFSFSIPCDLERAMRAA